MFSEKVICLEKITTASIIWKNHFPDFFHGGKQCGNSRKKWNWHFSKICGCGDFLFEQINFSEFLKHLSWDLFSIFNHFSAFLRYFFFCWGIHRISLFYRQLSTDFRILHVAHANLHLLISRNHCHLIVCQNETRMKILSFSVVCLSRNLLN